jgi:hypothetical protein
MRRVVADEWVLPPVIAKDYNCLEATRKEKRI